VSVLSKSVARIVGFVNVGGRTLRVYRDAYSALYGAIAKKNKVAADMAPPSIIYYEPIFVSDKPTAELTDKGVFRITLPNKYSTGALQGRILDLLRSQLEPLGVVKNNISILPFHSVKAVLRAYGRTYNVEVADDLSKVTIEVPRDHVPPSMRDEVLLLPDQEGGFKFVNGFTSLEFDYSFYVQKVQETACAFTVDREYVQKMYIDSTCTNPAIQPSDADLAKFEASNPNWKDVGTLVKRVSMPITSCLEGKEEERILQRSSVSCTTSLQKSDGSRGSSDLSDKLMQFAAKTHETVIENAKLTETPSEWTAQAAAAAVAMFGSPERFQQEIKQFNNDILNENKLDITNEKMDKAYDFVEKIGEFASRDFQSTSNSKSGGSSFLLISFGSKKNKSKSKTTFKEVIEKSLDKSVNERESYLKSAFLEEGLKHEIQNVGGSLKFFPKVTFSVKADVEKIFGAAQEMQVQELGDIVTENDAFSGKWNVERDAYLRGRVRCDGSEASVAILLESLNWWQDKTFMDNIAKQLSASIPTSGMNPGCENIGFDLWFDASSNSNLLPLDREVLEWNFRGALTPASPATSVSPYKFIELNRYHTQSNKPAPVNLNVPGARIRAIEIY
jgi:hypothetical protein